MLIVGYMTGEIIVQNMAYLELMPLYQCLDTDSGTWDSCFPSQFCQPGKVFDKSLVRVDGSSTHSFSNWVDQMDLTCETHNNIGLLGTMLFLGWMTSSLVIPRLSDIYGRKKFFLGFHLLQVAALIALLNCTSIHSAMAMLFFLGFASVGRSPIVYIYLLELMTPEYQKLVGPIFASSVGICLGFGTFLLHMVTKDANFLFYVSLLLSAFAIICTLLIVPESPKYLHATGQY